MVHPIIIKQSGDTLSIEGSLLAALKENPRSILWCNNGLYAIIPIEIIRNGLQFIENQNKLLELVNIPFDNKKHKIIFHWDQAEQIPTSTGKVMEQFNGNDFNDGS